jgi:anti-sigma B factor antagonist
MEIKTESQGPYTTLRVAGRLDLNSSTSLKEKIKSLLSEGIVNLVIDMGGVDFINSSGLGTLVSILKDVRMVKGKMVLCNLGRYVNEIFEITQLSHIFDLFPNEKEAAAFVTDTAVRVS